MSDRFDVEMKKENAAITERNTKKLAERAPNTFTILYREGEQTSRREYTEYFLEELETRSNNLITDINDRNEIDVRTSSYTYEVYLERNLWKTSSETRVDLRQILAHETDDRKIIELTESINKMQNELNSIINNPYTGENRDEYKLKILENVPNYMKDSFNIINYPKWGEVIEFDYNKLKAEMLDEYMKTGSKSKLDESYKNLLQDMEKFPNIYKIKNYRILEISEDMPYEIMEKKRLEREYAYELFNSDDYREILEKRINLNEARPVPPDNLTREQYLEWNSTVLKEWEILAKELWDSIPDKYKTTFNMILDNQGIHSYWVMNRML